MMLFLLLIGLSLSAFLMGIEWEKQKLLRERDELYRVLDRDRKLRVRYYQRGGRGAWN